MHFTNYMLEVPCAPLKRHYTGSNILLIVSYVEKIDAATSEVKMTNYSQDMTKKLFKQELTVPLHQKPFS